MANPFHLHNCGNFVDIYALPMPTFVSLARLMCTFFIVFSILRPRSRSPLWHFRCSISY